MAEPKRATYEEAKRALAPAGGPPEGPEVSWDKPPPSGPPEPPAAFPAHLARIVDWFDQTIYMDSLLLDRCIKRAMEIVELAVRTRMAGIDLFRGDGGGADPTHPMNYAALAAPMAIELYKQAVTAIERRADEYQAVLAEVKKDMERAALEKTAPTIITP